MRAPLVLFSLALVISACSPSMEPEFDELAAGEFGSWQWILGGEVNVEADEVCTHLVTSAGSAVQGAPICDPRPDRGNGKSRGGRASSSGEEIAHVRAVLGDAVADVRLLPEQDWDAHGETVLVRDPQEDVSWFVFFYDPRATEGPAELELLDDEGQVTNRLPGYGDRSTSSYGREDF